MNHQQYDLRGLYAIADASYLSAGTIVAAAGEAIDGGAKILQYREKGQHGDAKQNIARQLNSLCKARSIPFIVNDDVMLADAIGAAGVHLGREDGLIAAARQQLGSEALIGASCYGDLEIARGAAAAGADYLAFGAVFGSPTKPQAPTISLDIFSQAKSLGLPLVAIGGITTANAQQVIAAGADMVAVISQLFGSADGQITARADGIAKLFAAEAV